MDIRGRASDQTHRRRYPNPRPRHQSGIKFPTHTPIHTELPSHAYNHPLTSNCFVDMDALIPFTTSGSLVDLVDSESPKPCLPHPALLYRAL